MGPLPAPTPVLPPLPPAPLPTPAPTPAPTPQDGHCGNFNSNPGDDSRTAVRSRVGTTGVPQGELIFPGAKTPVSPGARPDLNDCPEGELNAAMAKCKAAEHTTFPSHACLIDTCLGHMAPKPA